MGNAHTPSREFTCLMQASATQRRKRTRHSKRKTTYVSREMIVRGILESMTRMTWAKSHPTWLKLGKKRQLELDCWNHRLSCGFEVSGAHHFNRIDHWQTVEEFHRQKENDLMKARMCSLMNVLLIIVPSREIVGDANLADFVMRMLAEHNILKRQPFRLLQ